MELVMSFVCPSYHYILFNSNGGVILGMIDLVDLCNIQCVVCLFKCFRFFAIALPSSCIA